MFDGKIGKQFGTMSFAKFVGDPHAANDQFGEDTFLNSAKNNKRSWKLIAFGCTRCFGLSAGKTLGEITQGAIEKFKSARLHTVDEAQNETKSCIRQT